MKACRHPLRRGRRGSETPERLQSVLEHRNGGGFSVATRSSAEDEGAEKGLTRPKVSERWVEKKAVPLVDGVPHGLQDVHGRSLEQAGLRVVLEDKRVVSEDSHGYRRKGFQEKGAPICKRG